MPIYEFYCPDCHMIFNFFSKSVNTSKRPLCPRCGRKKLERQVSSFSFGSRGGNNENTEDFPIDDRKMESAINVLANEAAKIGDNDVHGAVKLMRKFSDMTGMKFGNGIEHALGRLESGDDPDTIENEMGDLLEAEEPFTFPDAKGGKDIAQKRADPVKDDHLYEM
ncbi:MAG: zinc ribbon domain-containing protein [Lentisphaerae bacterium]|nr:zinc ribbon domain-containing protein [Lentisphaerota bacterium]